MAAPQGLARRLLPSSRGVVSRNEPDGEFVRRVYTTLLGRDPDDEGLRNYTAELRKGLPREDLVLAVAASGEYRARVATPGSPLHVVHHDYGGTTLTICIADDVGRDWYDIDWPDIPELTFLHDHRLRPGATVFDLGAHQGVYALAIAPHVRPGGRVVAVEANAFNVSLIDINQRLNACNDVVIVEAAVAERPGQVSFGRGGNGQVDSTSSYDDSVLVRAVTVDELAETYGPPDVVFLDVEGYECNVLRASRLTLQRAVDWHVEVHVRGGLLEFGGSLEEVLSFFPEERFGRYASNEIIRQPRPLTEQLLRELSQDRFYLTALAR